MDFAVDFLYRKYEMENVCGHSLWPQNKRGNPGYCRTVEKSNFDFTTLEGSEYIEKNKNATYIQRRLDI